MSFACYLTSKVLGQTIWASPKLNPWKYSASPHHTCHLQPPPCAAASVVNHLPPAWICTSWRTTFAMVILVTLIKSGTLQVSVMIKSTCRHLHFKPFKFLYCGSLHHHDKSLTRSQPFHRKSQRNLIPYTIPIPWGRILHIELTTWAREIQHLEDLSCIGATLGKYPIFGGQDESLGQVLSTWFCASKAWKEGFSMVLLYPLETQGEIGQLLEKIWASGGSSLVALSWKERISLWPNQ